MTDRIWLLYFWRSFIGLHKKHHMIKKKRKKKKKDEDVFK